MARDVRIYRLGASFIVLAAVVTTVLRLAVMEGPARHIDTDWLHAAGVCLTEQTSPYNISAFQDCWERSVAKPYLAPFVFPPIIFPLILPLGFMTAELARVYVDTVNLIAVLLLAHALWLLSQLQQRDGSARLIAACWTALGVSIGGISGAVFVGQPSVFVGLGVAWVILGIVRRSNFLFAIGLILCLMKPHLTILFVTAALFLFWKRLQIGSISAALFVGFFSGVTFLLGGNPVVEYATSLEAHRASAASLLSDATTLFGLPGLLELAGSGGLLKVSVATAISGSVFGWLQAGQTRGEGLPILLCGVAALGAILFAHKNYDFAVYAVIFAVAAYLSHTLKVALLLPALVIWRPTLLERIPLDISAEMVNATTTLCILWTGVLLVSVGARHLLATNRAADLG